VLLAAACHGDTALVEELALELLAAIATNLAPVPTTAPSGAVRKKIERVRILLAERPGLPWTLESLARLVGYSPFHLARRFRACTGTSVHRYLSDLRLAAALRRIEAGEASLATVAADLGFANHSHLTATLRRRMGVTPRAIRAQLQGRRSAVD
jgi:AraC-like DNA-binding protein